MHAPAVRAGIVLSTGRAADLGEVVVLAWEGCAREVQASVGSAAATVASRTQDWMLASVEHAVTLLELGLGDYRAALASSTRCRQDGPLGFVTEPCVVEAAVRCGDRRLAVAVTEDLAERIGRGPAIGLGLLERCRALVDPAPSADRAYRDSIAHLEALPGGFELARTRLLYGEWLRRSKRRIDARVQLRTAQEAFTAMGSPTFAARAQMELAATGERARRRSVDTRDDLTPQEARIAGLAAAGSTNAEIASSLFLSRSTVDYHLRKVFRKLAITSRRELVDAHRLQGRAVWLAPSAHAGPIAWGESPAPLVVQP